MAARPSLAVPRPTVKSLSGRFDNSAGRRTPPSHAGVAPDGPILVAGWLRRSVPVLAGFKQYHMRWVVLYSNALLLYEDQARAR